MDRDGLRSRLSAEQYDVCVNGATEPPFTGAYLDCKERATYRCACCGEALFKSESKFDSGTGWPSFWESSGAVKTSSDFSMGMVRTEARCACGAHLGHVFEDGPRPTGLRYCINSASLDLERA